ncbi:MAG: hypothetical protein ABIT76_13675 [Chthoniobacterales bacterium]
MNTPTKSSDPFLIHRCKQTQELAAIWIPRWFDADGEWTLTEERPATLTRTILQLCFGLLAGEPPSVELANRILEKLEFRLHVRPRSEMEITSPFDIFVTNHTTQMLVLHGAKLTEAVRGKLEGWARAGLEDFPGNRQADYQFHGFNDNMPAKASLGMILGGEYFGDAGAVEHGLWNLHQLGDLLSRRGLMSEYTSPVYTPLTLVNLTEIVQHARHPEARDLAARCVERIWADVLGHFHWPTGLMGGPYSRTYQQDRTAHLSGMNFFLWLALGDAVIPNPLEELGRDPIRLLHQHNERPVALGSLCWSASAQAEAPAHLVEWSRNRKYPFHLQATAERGCGLPNYRSCEPVLTHYQEEDFALGSALGESWTDGFFLQYRRTAPARGPEDVRTAYVSYFTDDDVPTDEHAQPNHLRMTVAQDGRTALLLARPKPQLAEREVTRLRLALVLPSHFGRPEQVEIRDGHVFVRDGRVYLGLRALNISNWGGPDSLRIEEVPGYTQVSLFNYEGAPRRFTKDELARTLNGFALTIGLPAEESFAAFQERILAAKYVDYWHFGVRNTRYAVGDTRLEISYSPEDDSLRYATVNGRSYPRPIWEADGLPAEQLPFLDGSWTPNELTIPYRHLRVIWRPDAPWMIASDGRGESASSGPGWRKDE